MTATNAPLKNRIWRPVPLAICLLMAPGCGSPPSVVPVMQVVERTLRQEAESLGAVQATRDRLYLQQARQQLDEGYRRDLADTNALSPQWVQSATTVYVAAREALLRQELELARQRQTRIDNLQLAAQAQGRAVALLQRQDNLLRQTLGLDLWRLDPTSNDAASGGPTTLSLTRPETIPTRRSTFGQLAPYLSGE